MSINIYCCLHPGSSFYPPPFFFLSLHQPPPLYTQCYFLLTLSVSPGVLVARLTCLGWNTFKSLTPKSASLCRTVHSLNFQLKFKTKKVNNIFNLQYILKSLATRYSKNRNIFRSRISSGDLVLNLESATIYGSRLRHCLSIPLFHTFTL